MSELKIKSITVSAASKRYTDTPRGSEDNFVSMSVEKEDGSSFTPQEAAQAKLHTTLALRRLLLMDELSQGLLSIGDYRNQKQRLDHCYTKLLTGDGRSFWRLDKDTEDDTGQD